MSDSQVVTQLPRKTVPLGDFSVMASVCVCRKGGMVGSGLFFEMQIPENKGSHSPRSVGSVQGPTPAYFRDKRKLLYSKIIS